MNKTELARKIQDLEGLSNEEKSSLLELIRGHKKYGLVWEDKPEDIEERLREDLPVLVERNDDKVRPIISDKPVAPNHLIIEGDNLSALTALQYTHKGKVDIIYIDPPYNTGNMDFMYNDKYVDSEDAFRHSKWLCFMSKRLELARQLLSPQGIILISIDDNEYSALKLLCDEIFGFWNFLTSFHIQVRYAEKSLNEEKPFKPLMEYVLFYANNTTGFKPVRETVDYGLEKFCFKISELEPGETFFVKNQEVQVFKPGQWSIEKIEGNLNGLKETWITGSIYTTMSYGKVFQSVVEPRIGIDGLGCLYKVLGRGDDGLGYRYYTGPARATAKKGKMFSGVPLDNVALFKDGKAPKRELPILTVFDFAPDFGNIRHEGGVPFGSGKKPIKMIKQFICYHSKKDAVVLDFFAGSGSTAHAVMSQNAEDAGNRTCILITNNESNICEDITYKRVSNVIRGYGKETGLADNNLRYYRTEFLPRERSVKNTRELVQASTGLLCIKNDLYTEAPFGGRKMNPKYARYFEHGNKRMLVVYEERAIPFIADIIKTMPDGEKIKVYVFSHGSYAYDDEFAEVEDRVELCALPQAIYDAYQKVLPKRKPKLLVDELIEEIVENDNAEDSNEDLFGLDYEKGGDE